MELLLFCFVVGVTVHANFLGKVLYSVYTQRIQCLYTRRLQLLLHHVVRNTNFMCQVLPESYKPCYVICYAPVACWVFTDKLRCALPLRARVYT